MGISSIFKKNRADLSKIERNIFSSRATFSEDNVRRHYDPSADLDYRQAFSVDADRIMHSSAYSRYIDKTQVFSLISNDHITHRALHVQLVSKIGRTIGRFLSMNEDLIEAISLGHDIGHTPFGHDGEIFLSKLCRQSDIGNFLHNVQSVHFLENVERKGMGCNLSLQTLDGILCHDGEVHDQVLSPNKNKTFKTLESEMRCKKKDSNFKIIPMTYEGCIVRLADTISYIGRDLEDAIRLNIIKRSEIPVEISESIGNTNGTIVHNLVTNVIQNSYNELNVGFSLEISHILKKLKDFNLEYIYTNSKIKKRHKTIEDLFQILFEICLENLETNNISSNIFSGFLSGMSEEYISNHNNPEIVRDYIAGMTDGYFLNQFEEHLRPTHIRL